MKQAVTIILVATALLGFSRLVSAYPSYFDDRCASCHSNDTPTCNGCHQHGPIDLSATADAESYLPGADVTITLDGGSKHGWIRGILYDENDIVVALASGPTGMGDDSQGDPVEYPVALVAAAPQSPGDHVWQAAWFGGLEDGSGHTESRVDVLVHVEATPVLMSSWSLIHGLYW